MIATPWSGRTARPIGPGIPPPCRSTPTTRRKARAPSRTSAAMTPAPRSPIRACRLSATSARWLETTSRTRASRSSWRTGASSTTRARRQDQHAHRRAHGHWRPEALRHPPPFAIFDLVAPDGHYLHVQGIAVFLFLSSCSDVCLPGFTRCTPQTKPETSPPTFRAPSARLPSTIRPGRGCRPRSPGRPTRNPARAHR